MTLIDIINPETLIILLAAYACVYVTIVNLISIQNTRCMIRSDYNAFTDKVNLIKLYHKSKPTHSHKHSHRVYA